MSQPLSREVEIEPAHAAILFVDVQNYNCSWDGGEYAQLDDAEKQQRYGYFFRQLKESALPNMALELEIINMIYCHVMSSEELLGYLPK
jgi:hypothetical protein